MPPRVLTFCWKAKNHKILTIDKLRRRNPVLVNGCPMCLKDEETVHHLLIHCQFAYRVWMVVINMFEMKWVMPRTVADLFIQWRLRSKFSRARVLWKSILYATLWKLWLERNN